MYYISKAQYQQLVQNKIDFGEGEYVGWADCIIPYGLNRSFDLGMRLMQLDATRPNFARCMNRHIIGEGTEHENVAEDYEWVEINVIRSEFLHDLKLAYEFWQYCRRYLPLTR